MATRRKRRFPALGKKVLLSFGSLLIAVLISEALLRLVGYRYSPLSINIHADRNDHRFRHAFENEDFLYDPILIWRPKEDAAVFNSQGFRGKELSEEKQPDEFRLFALGDSNTLGWHDADQVGENRGANWPAYLEQLMPSGDRQYSVTNAGVWGYSSFQGLGRFRQILRFHPDMVLVSFGSNDAHKVVVSDADYAPVAALSPLLRTRCGQLFQAMRDRLVTGRRSCKDEELVFRVGLDQYRSNLNEIVRIAKENGIQCVLLTRPFRGKSTDELYWKTHAPSYVAATIEVGQANGVPVIDVYSHFEDKAEYFFDESHFTEPGHRLAAKIIYQRIRPLLPP